MVVVCGGLCRGDGEGTSDPLNIVYFLFKAGIWNLCVNFAGGGWSEELRRGVLVKGVCVLRKAFSIRPQGCSKTEAEGSAAATDCCQ